MRATAIADINVNVVKPILLASFFGLLASPADVNRIFPVLAAFALALMAATLLLGLSLGDVRASMRELSAAESRRAALRSEAERSSSEAQQLRAKIEELRGVERWKSVHFLSGLLSAVVVMFVAGVAITYFVGTSRWCREVVDAYHLDIELARASARLKRRTFPVVVTAMVGLVVVAALGGASDPGANLQLEPPGSLGWNDIHFAAALLVLFLVAWAYYVAWSNITEHQHVMTKIMDEVKRIRAERGLPD